MCKKKKKILFIVIFFSVFYYTKRLACTLPTRTRGVIFEYVNNIERYYIGNVNELT